MSEEQKASLLPKTVALMFVLSFFSSLRTLEICVYEEQKMTGLVPLATRAAAATAMQVVLPTPLAASISEKIFLL